MTANVMTSGLEIAHMFNNNILVKWSSEIQVKNTDVNRDCSIEKTSSNLSYPVLSLTTP